MGLSNDVMSFCAAADAETVRKDITQGITACLRGVINRGEEQSCPEKCGQVGYYRLRLRCDGQRFRCKRFFMRVVGVPMVLLRGGRY